eukprot:CAMPEP_0202095054 /NCGR_PEP_ID=MMETSP0964-20121228/49351_1 /ASSEMBLY_ACC=CAM_ASM_000500 /TAXON_ID=4773 /ORGANISM="Schizochytrium aggregatum, Strain ATCC28209" /LENGTH=477 /DNA_ID=CAMNT_0048663309 /DNA_START=52 /DNA_END=1486 /DNA_ORIENTATION=-
MDCDDDDEFDVGVALEEDDDEAERGVAAAATAATTTTMAISNIVYRVDIGVHTDLLDYALTNPTCILNDSWRCTRHFDDFSVNVFDKGVWMVMTRERNVQTLLGHLERDLGVTPRGINIENITLVYTVGCKLGLETIHRKLATTSMTDIFHGNESIHLHHMDKQKYPALRLWPDKKRKEVLGVFATGKIVATGTKSWEAVDEIETYLHSRLMTLIDVAPARHMTAVALRAGCQRRRRPPRPTNSSSRSTRGSSTSARASTTPQNTIVWADKVQLAPRLKAMLSEAEIIPRTYKLFFTEQIKDMMELASVVLVEQQTKKKFFLAQYVLETFGFDRHKDYMFVSPRSVKAHFNTGKFARKLTGSSVVGAKENHTAIKKAATERATELFPDYMTRIIATKRDDVSDAVLQAKRYADTYIHNIRPTPLTGAKRKRSVTATATTENKKQRKAPSATNKKPKIKGKRAVRRPAATASKHTKRK